MVYFFKNDVFTLGKQIQLLYNFEVAYFNNSLSSFATNI